MHALNRTPSTLAASVPTEESLRAQIEQQVQVLLSYAAAEAGARDERTFKELEKGLIPRIFELAKLIVCLFLCLREKQVTEGLGSHVEIEGRRYHRRPPQPRNLNTWFGVVRYFRTYLRGPVTKEGRTGFHLLDMKLGLTADRLSMNVLSVATRLATKLSFAQTYAVLGWFMLQPPSTEVLEQAVLGLGRHTEEWFKNAPLPEGDGEVLMILIDGKASPTVTEQELERRRGKRRKHAAASARHRGRDKRKAYGKKPRRKKGDKSKNGRVATMVVMYTLKREGGQLLGPLNRRFYASMEYLGKRVELMNYGELIASDLEIGSGAVEGAIKHIIAARFDKGGMR